MSANSPIAVIANAENRDSQALLSDAIAAWRQAGLKVVGVLAENAMEEGVCSAGALRDLVSDEVFSIRLPEPAIDTHCDLDTTGLENAATRLLAQMKDADIVVLSKFGKAEAHQGGLWSVFQAAAHANTPLVTTVSSKHEQAWHAFAPQATRLAGDQAAIQQWGFAQTENRRQ